MTPADREAFHALLAQMRAIHDDLAENHAGICVLHLDAAVAALESHLRRDGVSLIEQLRQGLVAARSQDKHRMLRSRRAETDLAW